MKINMDDIISTYEYAIKYCLSQKTADLILAEFKKANINDPHLISACFFIFGGEKPSWLDNETRILIRNYQSGVWKYETKIMRLMDILTDMIINNERYKMKNVRKFLGCNSYLDEEVRKRISENESS